MYSGHYAAGLALKAWVPESPTWALLLGSTLLDLIWGPFILAGWEVMNSRQPVQIAWSHSLVMSAVWSVLYGLLFFRKGASVAIALGLAVFSHFVCDFLVHEPHLTFYPGSAARFGTGLGQAPWGPGWMLELAVISVCCGFYFAKARNDQRFGRHAGSVCGIVVGLHFLRATLGM